MSNEELYDILGEPIAKAARLTSTKWHGLLEAGEIESELWIEVLESPATARQLRGADPDLLIDLLVRMADRICIGERDDYEHFTGNYRYSVNEVKILVEEAFLRNGEELLVDLLDVDVAFADLSMTHPHYADTIYHRYALGEIPDTKATEHYLSKGLTKITDYMNRSFKDREREYRDGPGTKPRIPNGYDPYEGN